MNVNGARRQVKARLTSGEERKRLWELGTEIYPGWNAYERRARGRAIGIFVLQDVDPPATSSEKPLP